MHTLTPWDEGYAACVDGLDLDQNPYIDPNADEWGQWREGWFYAADDDYT